VIDSVHDERRRAPRVRRSAFDQEDLVLGVYRAVVKPELIRFWIENFVGIGEVTEIVVTTSMINETSLDQFFEPGTRRAMVAVDDAVYGMARMFALRAESVGQTIQIFRDAERARDWLGI
jgi:hypothetical protein